MGRVPSGGTAVHAAAAFGHLEVVLELLDRGGALDWLTKAKESPLHGASRNGHALVVKFLLQKVVNHPLVLGKIYHTSEL